MVVPHEFRHGLALDETRVPVLVRLRQGAVLLLLVEADGFPGLGEAAAQEEDVAVLEFNVALLGDLVDFFERDGVAVHAVDFLSWNGVLMSQSLKTTDAKRRTLLLAIRHVINQNTTSSNPVLRPVADANPVALHLANLVRGRAAIPPACTIVNFGAKVAEPIPLRGGLRVKAPDVVPCDSLVVGNGHNLVLASKSIEAWYHRKH